jgi:hypothetical protein
VDGPSTPRNVINDTMYSAICSRKRKWCLTSRTSTPRQYFYITSTWRSEIKLLAGAKNSILRGQLSRPIVPALLEVRTSVSVPAEGGGSGAMPMFDIQCACLCCTVTATARWSFLPLKLRAALRSQSTTLRVRTCASR